jgi:ankyrin repeat protein
VPNTRDELLAAIDAGDAAQVRAIVDADPRLAMVRDDDGVSALMRTRYRSDQAMVEALLPSAGDLDVFEAVTFGELDRVTELWIFDPAIVAARSGDGFTPLHLAAFFGQTEALGFLLERGAEVDAVGTGWMTGTPLHAAASGRHAEAIARLLSAGARPDVRQAGGWTPLHAAAMNGDERSTRLLLDAGADPAVVNDEGVGAAVLAERSGNADVIAMIAGEPGS